jgi:hypothetical protein
VLYAVNSLLSLFIRESIAAAMSYVHVLISNTHICLPSFGDYHLLSLFSILVQQEMSDLCSCQLQKVMKGLIG